MTFPSGSRYTGEWRSDRMHGHGSMLWEQSQERYSGDWRDGVQHGVGEHVWYAGMPPPALSRALYVRFNRYVGMMAGGRRSGEGAMLYATGVQALPRPPAARHWWCQCCAQPLRPAHTSLLPQR